MIVQSVDARRHGAALVAILAAMAVASVLMTMLTWQTLAEHRFLRRRENQLQAQWLARAGIELAANALHRDGGKYRGETVQLLPGGSVTITVTRPKDADFFLVQSETRFPGDDPEAVGREETRRFRRSKEGRLEVVPEPAPSQNKMSSEAE